MNSDDFNFNTFPIAIRVVAKTIAQDLVCVQPMDYPFKNKYEELRKERRKKYKKLFE